MSEQVLGLVETELAHRGRGSPLREWRSRHRLERAEVRVMEEALTLEAGHQPEDLAVSLSRGTDHELRGRAHRGDVGRVTAQPPLSHEAAGALEVRQQVTGEILLARERPHVGVGGRLEVHRHAIGQANRRIHLVGLGARQELQVYVAVEFLPPAQQVDRREHPVGHLCGATGNARRQE